MEKTKVVHAIKGIATLAVLVSLLASVVIKTLPASAQSTVSINYNDVRGNSTYRIGESYELKGSEYVDAASQTKIANITKDSLALQNQHIIGFGSTALWTNPVNRNPSSWNWASLDAKIGTMRQASGAGGAKIVITLGMAPAWMTTHQAKNSPSYPAYSNWTDYPGASVGNPNSKYTANPAINDGSITNDTINASVDPWFEDDFAYMAAQVADRYDDVVTFQVWNEMKGYYKASENRWDHEQYTSLYNKVYTAVKAARPDAKLGGPYVVVGSWHNVSLASHPASSNQCKGAWGAFDQRDINVIDYWLDNKVGADYIVVDGSTTTSHDTDPTFDQFQTKAKTDALKACIASVTPSADSTLPVGIAEYYPKASGGGTMTQQRAAAITANALGDTIDNKFDYVLLWDLMAQSCDPLESQSLIALSSSVNLDNPPNTNGCDILAQQGQPSALAPVLKGIKERFGSGAILYAPQFDNQKLGVFASSNGMMIVNKQAVADTAIINGCTATSLAAYEVKFLDLVDCIKPTTPDNFTANVTVNVVDLSWSSSSDSNSSVTGYKIYRDNVLIATRTANQLSYSETYNGSTAADFDYSIESIDTYGNASQRFVIEDLPVAAAPSDPDPDPDPEDPDPDDPDPDPETPDPEVPDPDDLTPDDDFTPNPDPEDNLNQPSSPATGIGFNGIAILSGVGLFLAFIAYSQLHRKPKDSTK
jgi:hypothetical protein